MVDDGIPSMDRLTGQDRELLGLIQQGRPDAEIAVRLGITVAEAKQRIETLTWKARAQDRAELRALTVATPDTSDAVPDRPGRARSALVLVALVSLGADLLGGWSLRGDSDSPGAAPQQVSGVEPESVVPNPGTPPPATPTPRTMVLDGYLMESAGRPFALPNGLPAPTVEIRDSFAIVRLPDAAVLRYGDAGWGFRGGGLATVHLTAQLGVRTVSLMVAPVDGTRFVLGDDDSIALVSENSAVPPSVIISASSATCDCSYRVAMDASGELFISSTLFPINAPLSYDTGELLPVSDGFGIVDPGNYLVFCASPASEGRCVTAVPRIQAIAWPVSGTLRCEQGELTLTTVRHIFHLRPSGLYQTVECSAREMRLNRGDSVPYYGRFVISATDSEGRPLSVVIALGGSMYVGDFTARYACPCRPTS